MHTQSLLSGYAPDLKYKKLYKEYALFQSSIKKAKAFLWLLDTTV